MQKEMKNFIITSNGSGYKETEHPTEKPLSLIKYLIEIHSNPKDLILDCFMGSGTTAVACKQLGRRFIGCDNNKEYIKIANKRLEQTNLMEDGIPPKPKVLGILPTII